MSLYPGILIMADRQIISIRLLYRDYDKHALYSTIMKIASEQSTHAF